MLKCNHLFSFYYFTYRYWSIFSFNFQGIIFVIILCLCIVSFQALPSNNDPSIVGKLFVDTVSSLGHAPKLVRTDCGTENGTLAAIQSYLYDNERAHLYGKSTSNQRIEALWSKLRPALDGWIDFLKEMQEDGIYDSVESMQVYSLRYAFSSNINEALDQFRLYWNSHRIRQSADAPGGIPDILFHVPEHCGVDVDIQKLNECREHCASTISVTGDPDIDDFFNEVSRDNGLPHSNACTRDQCKDLYVALNRLVTE